MTHSMNEINTFIKQLRLSHITQHLPQRNREAIEGKLAYPEFLSPYYKMKYWVDQTQSCWHESSVLIFAVIKHWKILISI